MHQQSSLLTCFGWLQTQFPFPSAGGIFLNNHFKAVPNMTKNVLVNVLMLIKRTIIEKCGSDVQRLM